MAGEEITEIGQEVSEKQQLPPEVHPYKLLIDWRGRGRDKDEELLREFEKKGKEWWARIYRGKVPQDWTDPESGASWHHITRFIEKTPRQELEKQPVLIEAIVTNPISHCYRDLAEKVPLTARLLALGEICSVQVGEKSGLFFRGFYPSVKDAQRKLNVSEKVFEEAERLAKNWDGQRKVFEISRRGKEPKLREVKS